MGSGQMRVNTETKTLETFVDDNLVKSKRIKLRCGKCGKAVVKYWNYCPYCSDKLDMKGIKI